MTTSELFDWISKNVYEGTARNPETGKPYKMREVKEIGKTDVIIRVGGKERSLNACKVENGKLILIG